MLLNNAPTSSSRNRTAFRSINNDENATSSMNIHKQSMKGEPFERSMKGKGLAGSNDENAFSFQKNSIKKLGGLKSRSSNITTAGGSSLSSKKGAPKTPSSKTSQRRVLGDISNRKHKNQSGIGGGVGRGIASSSSSTVFTPAKYRNNNASTKKTKRRANNSLNKGSNLQKSVTFDKHVLVGGGRSEINNHSKTKEEVRQAISSLGDVEDIEMPAGRTWIEEQELLSDDNSIDSSIEFYRGAYEDHKAILQNERNAYQMEMKRQEDKADAEYNQRMIEFEKWEDEEIEMGVGSLFEHMDINFEDDIEYFESSLRDDHNRIFDCEISL